MNVLFSKVNPKRLQTLGHAGYVLNIAFLFL